MTLNDLERQRNSLLAFISLNSTDFQADYITVVEDNVRKILSPSSSLLAKTNTHPAARSLCNSALSILFYCSSKMIHTLMHLLITDNYTLAGQRHMQYATLLQPMVDGYFIPLWSETLSTFTVIFV